MSESISSVMEKAFDKVLPIPKTPRVYRSPPPPRPLTWVPHGTLGNFDYEERLTEFAQEVLAENSRRSNPIKYSSRGWCYMLEGLGKIHKGEFNACQKAINDCRKIGLLPINFVAEDQDTTRHFKGIHVASEPQVQFKRLKKDVQEMLDNLPSRTTDYWIGEEYYVMVCVEKGDILNLFKPICREYHVPIVSSKGWAPIRLRGHIATLCERAERNGLKPVLLLFYDHDPAGIKITKTFRKNLSDCERGTGWSPDELIIERFGLNKEAIDKYNLMWIENLRTGSGRESRDWEYRRKYGARKCESNALFKNDETLRAAEEICRNAIEKYYGTDALERFAEKEKIAKEKLKNVYEDPLWQAFFKRMDKLVESIATKKKEKKIQALSTFKPELSDVWNFPTKKKKHVSEVTVVVDGKYYGKCPKCGCSFNYSKDDVGRLVRCRNCNLPMRLKWKSEAGGVG